MPKRFLSLAGRQQRTALAEKPSKGRFAYRFKTKLGCVSTTQRDFHDGITLFSFLDEARLGG
jgi:hypothetical protein